MNLQRLGEASTSCSYQHTRGYEATARPRPLHGADTGQRWARRDLACSAQARMSVREMSSQMQQMRSQMEEDEQVKILMAGLRGSNINDSDFADDSVVMRLVNVDDEDPDDKLPLAYSPDLIADFWGRRPVAVTSRILQLLGISWDFLSKLAWDVFWGRLAETEVARATELRNIVTSLGPAYIKLGQALSIRPDILSPAAMNELQKLCDKVPSFDNATAMKVIQDELGAPWYQVYAELSPAPIAAASLGQVYKGRLKTGEDVAVKVQRPYVLETVTVDLFIIRKLGMFLRRFPQLKTDVVALLDEWATRFFEELDYVHEGNNGTLFAESIKDDLPQVVVPRTYAELTSRRVLTTSWLEGEKLSQSKEDDVKQLVNLGVICYLKQLLDTGFFHADPHPGNLIRTPDGRLAILDFGLMTQIDDNIKYGMIEAISHLIHRDYEAIVEDFVTLDFIPKGTDLSPILPVLAKVFDQALAGGGAKSINFQELAADLASVTFEYPFRIPPYFALIIRAISVLEGIALVGDPAFAIVDEAYPYVAKRLLTDNSPRLQAALQYMIYGKENVFDVERLIDLLGAFETFREASQSARGNLDSSQSALPSSSRTQQASISGQAPTTRPALWPAWLPSPEFPLPSQGYPIPAPALLSGLPGFPLPMEGFAATTAPAGAWNSYPAQQGIARYTPGAEARNEGPPPETVAREALRFILSSEGAFFREFITAELVQSIDGLTRSQLVILLQRLGLHTARLPVLLPGSTKAWLPLAPTVTADDQRAVENVIKLSNFLMGGSADRMLSSNPNSSANFIREMIPFLPSLATELVPELVFKLWSRISARVLRELYE